MTTTKTVAKSKKHAPKPKTWTVILYMAGDNNLTEDMIAALKDLRKFAGNKRVKVLALYDSAYPPVPVAFYDFSTNHGGNEPLKGFTTLEDLRKIQNKPKLPVTHADAYKYEEWREFVKLKTYVPWVLKQRQYKSDNYALILSGHSDGIIGRTILRDDNPPKALNLRTLGDVLSTCTAALPAGKKKKFDILGFDGCLMGMIETAYQLKDHADVMISSQGNIPNSGWHYPSAIKAILAGGSNEKIAKAVASGYRKHNRDYSVSGRVVNVSAFKLSETEKFAKKIGEIARILHFLLELFSKKKTAQTASTIISASYQQRFSEMVQLSHLRSQMFMHNQAVDVMDFLYNLIDLKAQTWLQLDLSRLARFLSQERGDNSDDAAISDVDKGDGNRAKELRGLFTGFIKLYKAYKELVQIHRKFVLESCFVGAEYQFSRGVSIFLPWNQMALNLLSTQYEDLEFNKDVGAWQEFFRKYVGLTLRTPETSSLLKKVKKTAGQITEKTISTDFGVLLQEMAEFGREYIGKEYIGKEYIGKGDAFYAYFSDFRNYSHIREVDPPVTPPEYDVDFHDCNDAESVI